jgi:hypothetical protein
VASPTWPDCYAVLHWHGTTRSEERRNLLKINTQVGHPGTITTERFSRTMRSS